MFTSKSKGFFKGLKLGSVLYFVIALCKYHLCKNKDRKNYCFDVFKKSRVLGKTSEIRSVSRKIEKSGNQKPYYLP